MNTEVKAKVVIGTDLKKYKVSAPLLKEIEAAFNEYSGIAIKKMEDKFLPLKIKDHEDKEGYAKVHAARMNVKNKRVEVKKIKAKLKEESIAYNHVVDGVTNRLINLLQPIEDTLKEREKVVDDKKAEILEAKKRAQKEKLQRRVNALNVVKAAFFVADIEGLSDEDFDDTLRDATEAFDAENRRIAEQEAKDKEEKGRLEKQRIEQERVAKEQADREAKIKADQEARDAEFKAQQDEIAKKQADKEAELKAKQDKIDADKKALDDAKTKEEADKKHAIEIEKAKKEAAAKAKREEKEAAERKEKKRLEDEKKAKAKAERIERLKPDKEKIVGFVEAVSSLSVPELKSEEAKAVMADIAMTRAQFCRDSKEACEDL